MLVGIENLIGQTLSYYDLNHHKTELVFVNNSGDTWTFYHEQDCCESVYLDDVSGELEDILDSEILSAYESSRSLTDEENFESGHDECSDWYFYHIATIKGSVVLRWIGSSNGYYSTQVSIDFQKKKGTE